MKYIFCALLLCFFTSCDKADPNPELSDEIYKDYAQELDISKKSLEGAEKEYQKILLEKNKAVPQTGQIKFIQQRATSAEKQVDLLKQQKQFFEIKMELRKTEVKERYLESRARGGRPWPDKTELEIYRTGLKLQREKIAWDKNKGMKKSVPRGTPMKSEHGSEEKKEEAPAAEHGSEH